LLSIGARRQKTPTGNIRFIAMSSRHVAEENDRERYALVFPSGISSLLQDSKNARIFSEKPDLHR